MNTSPKVSVIMPFYNSSKFLNTSLKSVVDQTFRDFELILIDDASTDGSERIVKVFLGDDRIKYILNSKNVGITENLNKGIQLASAEIIARMDGDDISEPTRFEKQYALLQRNPQISFVGCFVNIINEYGTIIDRRTKPIDTEEIRRNAIIYNPLVHPSVMFRKQAVVDLGGYRTLYGKAEDQDLWLRALHSGYQISNVPEFLLKYRYHTGSTSHSARTNAINDYRLRRDTIRQFKLRISLAQRVNVLGQFAVGILFSGRQRQYIEGLYKRIFLHAK